MCPGVTVTMMKCFLMGMKALVAGNVITLIVYKVLQMNVCNTCVYAEPDAGFRKLWSRTPTGKRQDHKSYNTALFSI
jgi:hypothetical protein